MRIPVIAALIATSLVALALTQAERAAADESCLGKDKTGMAWVHPFDAAKEKATTEKRLLMIKPVAFGTSQDGGW